jgi:hypothetical protein
MNLQMSLRKKWFDMTKPGVKPEDYRAITPYWLKRLFEGFDEDDTDSIFEEICYELMNFDLTLDQLQSWAGMRPKKFEFNIMTLGYPKSTDTSRILKLEHAGIEIREGKPEWGAIPGKKYFVIKHGKLI